MKRFLFFVCINVCFVLHSMAQSVISITNPASGAIFKAPATFVIGARVLNSDYKNVEFLASGKIITQFTDAPYVFTNRGVGPGIYQLTAIASTAAIGADIRRATSSVVQIKVVAAPTITIASPSPGAIFDAPATFAIRANAAPETGVTNIQILLNNSIFGTSANAAYIGNASGLGAGTYTIAAIATDTNGFKAITNVTVTVTLRPCANCFSNNYVDPGGVLPGFASNLLTGSLSNVFTNTSLGFTINFCGNPYSNAWVNEDGNITLDGPFGGNAPPACIPAFPLGNLSRVIFAPFWADLDTTTNGAGFVGWATNCAFVNDLVLGRPAFGVTWSNVGYYHHAGRSDKTNSFQLLIIERSTNGDFDLQYRYGGLQWDTADSASGHGGLCSVVAGVQDGYPARVGFAGPNHPGFEWGGSGISGALRDGGTNALANSSTNATAKGVYIWHFTNGWFIDGQ